MVRAPARHAGGRGFESHVAHINVCNITFYQTRFFSGFFIDKIAAEAYVHEILKQGGKRREKIMLKDYTRDFFAWDKCKYIKR